MLLLSIIIMKWIYNSYLKLLSIIFDWAVARSDRSRKRWHNLFYNSIAFYADMSLVLLYSLRHYYYKFTLPYGLSDSSEDS